MKPPSSETIKSSLRHTWTPFFSRHGNFTPVQEQAIPPILAGQNTLLVAPTASGKTEAVIAPLLERHIFTPGRPRDPATASLNILYICPTRALVRDLYERLAPALADLAVPLSLKSGDTGPVSRQNPPTVLITTPESTDSLLTRAPRLLADLAAIVLDEIHLFDRGPRGDHLRCLLGRIEYIRRYHQQQQEQDPIPLQRVALSATVPDPEGVAGRYLVDAEAGSRPVIVQAGGGRELLADLVPMTGLDDLVAALARRAGPPLDVRKSLVFCNTRNEIEQTAAFLRQNLPYEAAVFVHYSNLDPAMRREVEDGFAGASVAVCVSSSTLELGIDIGSIDDIALIGPPPSLTSFLQRIGRGGRRTGLTRVLCLPRSPLEELRFHALLSLSAPPTLPLSPAPTLSPSLPLPLSPSLPPAYHFRPSVLVQQSFSGLKQSPTGGLRLADLRRIAPDAIPDDDLRAILGELVGLDYLRPGRLGEWRGGPALDELADAHEIYSNIGADPLAATVVDAYTGRTIAQTERIRTKGETFLLGGRLLEVVWRDRYRLGVRAVRRGGAGEELRFVSSPFAVPLDVSQAAAAQLGLAAGQLCQIYDDEGVLLWHFWGDLYGAFLGALLEAYFGADDASLVSRVNEHCLGLPTGLVQLPPWDEGLVRRQLRRWLGRVQDYLELGRFHSLLPPELAYRAVLAQCDLPRFENIYRAATIITPEAGLRRRLFGLIR